MFVNIPTQDYVKEIAKRINEDVAIDASAFQMAAHRWMGKTDDLDDLSMEKADADLKIMQEEREKFIELIIVRWLERTIK
jgi:flagellar hook-basal body complex protein FliE